MAETSTIPTRRDEAWRYADISALERLGAAALDAWEEIALAEGETWRHCMVVGSYTPELHRIRLTLGAGARAELFVTNAGNDYTRVEVEVTLGRGAHFEFGGVTIGGGDAVREFITTTIHAEPEATSNQTVRSVHWGTGTGNFLGEIKVARHAQRILPLRCRDLRGGWRAGRVRRLSLHPVPQAIRSSLGVGARAGR